METTMERKILKNNEAILLKDIHVGVRTLRAGAHGFVVEEDEEGLWLNIERHDKVLVFHNEVKRI
jgi:hypothetical protein